MDFVAAAAVAGKAVQVHKRGHLALGIGQGHDAAQGVAIAVLNWTCKIFMVYLR